jgi:hypothetical protein
LVGGDFAALDEENPVTESLEFDGDLVDGKAQGSPCEKCNG